MSGAPPSKAPRSSQQILPSTVSRVASSSRPERNRSPAAVRPRHQTSQPTARAPGAASMPSSARARAPSNTMDSRGRYSSVAPRASARRATLAAVAPAERYHLVAPGVVASTSAPAAQSTVSDSESPPAKPAGGCSTIAWQGEGPSGCSTFWISSGPLCRSRAGTVREPRRSNASASSAHQPLADLRPSATAHLACTGKAPGAAPGDDCAARYGAGFHGRTQSHHHTRVAQSFGSARRAAAAPRFGASHVGSRIAVPTKARGAAESPAVRYSTASYANPSN